MGQGPDQIRRDIDQTRDRMGRTFDALEDRLSPRRIAQRSTSQMRARYTDVKDSLKENVMGQSSDGADRMRGSAQQAAERVRGAPEEITSRTEGNPLAAGVIAFGAGMLAASLLPRTRSEQRFASELEQRMEPVKEQATSAGREIAEDVRDSARQGMERTKETASQATQEVRDEAQSATERAKSQAQDSAEEVRLEAKDAAGDVKQQAGQAKEHATSGNGNGDARSHTEEKTSTPYENRTVRELQRLASERGIPGAYDMNKGDLITALRRR